MGSWAGSITMRASKHPFAAIGSAVAMLVLCALPAACSIDPPSPAATEASAAPVADAIDATAPTAVVPAAVTSEVAAPPPPELARRRLDGYVDEALCATLKTGDSLGQIAEPDGPRRKFSVHGYVARALRLERQLEGSVAQHCISVSWPPADVSTDGAAVSVAAHIDDGWFRGIENTLARVPWHHVLPLLRIVIDNRPMEHGIAPFDQRAADDARDGHTLWLHEQLFRDPNHWFRGNFGGYWSYHVDQDKTRLDDQPGDHALFSPVLLHELGHLVSYNVINGNPADPSVPRCARMCGDREGGCDELEPAEKEAGCISPYCMPFNLATGTENWAEQYRFYYQSKKTRNLVRAAGGCARVLAAQDKKGGAVHPAPWEAGLPDIARFQRSVWESCDNKQCKPF
jgi:hypothetical protein